MSAGTAYERCANAPTGDYKIAHTRDRPNSQYVPSAGLIPGSGSQSCWAAPWQLLRRRCLPRCRLAAPQRPSESRHGVAPLEEILAALNRAFGVHYQFSVNLDKRLTGRYEGSLPQVLARILNGYKFGMYTDNGAMAVTVAAPGASPGRPGSSSAQVVRQLSTAAPSAQGPVSASDVTDVARKAPSSLVESVAGQSGAPAPAPPPQPMPTTAALQPRPSTAALQPRPSAAAPQPMPSTAAPQPMSSTAAPQPMPSTGAPQPKQSSAASQPRPSRGSPP